jgi:hypothetical protein
MQKKTKKKQIGIGESFAGQMGGGGNPKRGVLQSCVTRSSCVQRVVSRVSEQSCGEEKELLELELGGRQAVRAVEKRLWWGLGSPWPGG